MTDHPEDSEELLAKAAELRDQAAEVKSEVVTVQTRYIDLETYGKRTRRMIRWVAGSVALDVLLTIGLAWNASGTRKSLRRTERNHTALVVACQDTNRVRAEDIQLWNFILTLPPQPGQRQDPQILARFRTALDQAFAPQDCSKVK